MRYLALLLVFSGACGGESGAAPDATPDAAAGPRDWDELSVPRSDTPEAGIRRELIAVPCPAAPANPTTGETTPPALDATYMMRYRQDVDPPAPARAIAIAYPGFLGGAGSFDVLARHLVRRSVAAGAPIEVWAIDRRANGLEHLRGLDTALAAGNPEIAHGYYFGVDTIGGERFPGYLTQDQLGYLSEWGLATHVEDLHRVIALVPEAERRGRVFLIGHSLGASFAEAYAAWRFADGTRGVDELAGLILIDGVLGDEPLDEQEYHDGFGGGLYSVPGVDAIRDELRAFEMPIFGVPVYTGIEVLALRVLHDPDAVLDDWYRDDNLRIQLQLGSAPVPAMTNAAALGWAIDDGSNSISITATSCGAPTGGAVESYDNALAGAELVRPSDPDATYAWLPATEQTEGEHTELTALAEAFTGGPSNLAEWYFPMRLTLDLRAVGGAAVPDDGWHAAEGLRAFDGALIDAPILAIPSALQTVADYDAVAARVAPALGDGRPHAGLGRDDARAFRVVDATHMTHLDPVTGADWPANPVPEAVVDFVAEHAAAGSVALPAELP